MKQTFEPMVHEWVQHQIDASKRVILHAEEDSWSLTTFFGEPPGDTTIQDGHGRTFREAVLNYEQAKPQIVPSPLLVSPRVTGERP